MATTYYVDAATGSDSNAGTSTGAAFLTIAHALSVVAAGDTVYIKAGTYVQTASLNIPVATLTVIGYGVTPGDNGTKPLITTAINSVALWNTGSSNNGVQIFNNLSMSNTATTRASGIWQLSAHGTAQTWVFVNCLFDGFNRAIDNSNGTPFDVAFIHLMGCEIKNTVTESVNTGNSNFRELKVYGCYFHNNFSDINSSASAQGTIWLAYTIFANSITTICLNLSDPIVIIDHCTFANNSNSSATVSLSGSTGFTSITNNIFYGSTFTALTGGNVTFPGIIAAIAAGHSNAFGGNGTNFSQWSATPGDVTLSTNPFTNAGAGDYSLNSTAGGGAACKGAGFPGVFPGGLSTGHADIGAVQSSGGGGGGGGSSSVFIA